MTPPASRWPRSPFDRLRARGLAVQLVVLLAVLAVAWHAVRPVGAVTSPSVERLAALLVYASVAGLLALRAWHARLDWRRLLGPWPSRESMPLLGVVIPVALLTMGAAIATYIPLSYVAPAFVEQLMNESGALFEARTIGDWLELVAIAVVAAPIVEELFFRGFLLQRWARRWGTATGVVASSTLFAVLHGEWIGHFLVGVAMCVLYLRTRQLWMPIVAHMLNNGIVAMFSLVDVLRHAPPETTTVAELRGEWPLGMFALAGGGLLLWWYLRRYWPDGQWRAVLRGPTPYDGASYAASATGSSDSTSVS